jgi:hypothetical protein
MMNHKTCPVDLDTLEKLANQATPGPWAYLQPLIAELRAARESLSKIRQTIDGADCLLSSEVEDIRQALPPDGT